VTTQSPSPPTLLVPHPMPHIRPLPKPPLPPSMYFFSTLRLNPLGYISCPHFAPMAYPIRPRSPFTNDGPFPGISPPPPLHYFSPLPSHARIRSTTPFYHVPPPFTTHFLVPLFSPLAPIYTLFPRQNSPSGLYHPTLSQTLNPHSHTFPSRSTPSPILLLPPISSSATSSHPLLRPHTIHHLVL